MGVSQRAISTRSRVVAQRHHLRNDRDPHSHRHQIDDGRKLGSATDDALGDAMTAAEGAYLVSQAVQFVQHDGRLIVDLFNGDAVGAIRPAQRMIGRQGTAMEKLAMRSIPTNGAVHSDRVFG